MNFIAVFSLSRPDFSKRNRYDMLYNFNIVYQLMKKVIIRLQIPMDAKQNRHQLYKILINSRILLLLSKILVTFPRDFKINQQSVMCLKVLKS